MTKLEPQTQELINSIQKIILDAPVTISFLPAVEKSLHFDADLREMITKAKKKRSLGEYALSFAILIEVLNTALSHAKSDDSLEIYVDALYAYGWSCQEMEELEKADLIFKNQLELAQTIKYLQGQANAYNGLGVVAHKRGAYSQSLNYYEDSLVIKKQLNDPIEIGTAYINIATALWELGHYDMALDMLDQAKVIYNSLDQNREFHLAYVYGNASEVLREKGEIAHALEESIKCLQACVAGGIRGMSFVEFLQYNGRLWRTKGESEKALELLLECEKRTHKLKVDKPDLLLDISQVLANMGQFKEAKNYLSKAENLVKTRKSSREWALYLFRCGELTNKQRPDNYDVIQNYYSQAKELADQSSFFKIRIQARLALARLYTETGKLEDGLGEIDEALRTTQIHSTFYLMIRCLSVKALILSTQFKFKAAYETLDEAQSIIKKYLLDPALFELRETKETINESKLVNQLYDTVIHEFPSTQQEQRKAALTMIYDYISKTIKQADELRR
ncbi:MAG: tetratricopeptide repeat protein [Candidatus Hodarchaeota archaeon]